MKAYSLDDVVVVIVKITLWGNSSSIKFCNNSFKESTLDPQISPVGFFALRIIFLEIDVGGAHN